jgi:hypothetical protein
MAHFLKTEPRRPRFWGLGGANVSQRQPPVQAQPEAHVPEGVSLGGFVFVTVFFLPYANLFLFPIKPHH